MQQSDLFIDYGWIVSITLAALAALIWRASSQSKSVALKMCVVWIGMTMLSFILGSYFAATMLFATFLVVVLLLLSILNPLLSRLGRSDRSALNKKQF